MDDPEPQFTTFTDFQKFVLERNEAMRRLDLNWFREHYIGITAEDEILLCTIHKSRYEVVAMGPVLREESRKWLTERSYGRLDGLPWPPEGVLEDNYGTRN